MSAESNIFLSVRKGRVIYTCKTSKVVKWEKKCDREKMKMLLLNPLLLQNLIIMKRTRISLKIDPLGDSYKIIMRLSIWITPTYSKCLVLPPVQVLTGQRCFSTKYVYCLNDDFSFLFIEVEIKSKKLFLTTWNLELQTTPYILFYFILFFTYKMKYMIFSSVVV